MRRRRYDLSVARQQVTSLAAYASLLLAMLYPQAIATFWGLAVLCAGLRYLMDAHWPSDVLGGVALGYGIAYAAACSTRTGYSKNCQSCVETT